MLTSRDTETLPAAECLRLLETVPLGRLVFTEGALPVVHPVNFLRHENSVVIRTGAGTELDAARRGDIVAFEADDIDPETHQGWSVLVVGRAGSKMWSSSSPCSTSSTDPGPAGGART